MRKIFLCCGRWAFFVYFWLLLCPLEKRETVSSGRAAFAETPRAKRVKKSTCELRGGGRRGKERELGLAVGLKKKKKRKKKLLSL